MVNNVYMPDSADAQRIVAGIANTANVDIVPIVRGLDYQSYVDGRYYWSHVNGHNDPTATPYWIWFTTASDTTLSGNPINSVLGRSWVLWFQNDGPKYIKDDYQGTWGAMYMTVYSGPEMTSDQKVPVMGIGGTAQVVRSDLSKFPEGWGWHFQNRLDWWTPWDALIGADGDNFILLGASVPVTIGNQYYEPVGPQPDVDERYATKDPNLYNMIIGVRTTEYSEEVTGGIPGAEFNYFRTVPYNITAHWDSPVDGFAFSVPLTQLTQYTLNARLEGPGPVYAFNFSTSSAVGSIAQSLRSPLGRYTGENQPPTEYEDMAASATMADVPLTWLKEQASMQKPGVVNNDLFTTIYIDFIDSSNSAIIETKEIDYSSLYGMDIDLSGGTVPSPNDDPDIPNTNQYTDNIGLTIPSLTATGVFNRCYVMDANGINDLCDYLYNASDSIWEEIIDGVLTRGNPIESLIDLRLYPFDVRQFTGAGTAERIKFGRTETTVVGTKLPSNSNAVIDMGECSFNREYNNFLDYHMKAELYIPFCGVQELPIERILNKKISVKMIVDFLTGACTAVVYADKLPIQYRQGVMGISIPMTATNSAEFGKSVLGNLVKAGTSIATGAASVAGAMETGNIAGATTGANNVVGGVLDFASSLYNGSHVERVGSSSPQCTLFQPKQCYLMISIPTPMKGVYENSYADLVGYATFMPVSSISWMNNTGFTVFDNVKMDVAGATDEEKAMILNLLTSGVYM